MNDLLKTIMVSAICSVSAISMFLVQLKYNTGISAPAIYKELNRCQKELPRNQECEIVITAVVKEEG